MYKLISIENNREYTIGLSSDIKLLKLGALGYACEKTPRYEIDIKWEELVNGKLEGKAGYNLFYIIKENEKYVW